MKKTSKNLKKAVIPVLAALFIWTAPLHPSIGGSLERTSEESRKPVIAVLGSSLAAGWVTSREARFDMQNGWAFRLERMLAERGFEFLNISQPGDTTEKVLSRLDQDLFPREPDIVIISLSLENEGIRGIDGKIPDKVYEGFKSNIQTIIRRCREQGIIPIVASCYPSDNYTEGRHYRYIKDMNLEMAAWDVPGINLLGALDNGLGGFIEGVTFDLDHPDSRGHAELFYSVVPGLFEALRQRVPLPSGINGSGCLTLEESMHPAPLSFIPEDPIHSFAVAFEIRPGSTGTLLSIQNEAGGFSRLRWDDRTESLLYESVSGQKIPVPIPSKNGENWIFITLSHRYLKGETQIFVDGRPEADVEEVILPVHIILGGPGEEIPSRSALSADFRNWMIYRSAMNDLEAASLAEGNLLQPSLELYIPLDEDIGGLSQPLKNRAQSTSRASAWPRSWGEQISALKEKSSALARSEKIFIDPETKQPVPIDPGAFEELAGDFTVDDNLVLTVAKEKGRLFLLFNGGNLGKLELFPLSSDKYFMRIVGPYAEAEFKRDTEGLVTEIKLAIGPNTIIGKKKP